MTPLKTIAADGDYYLDLCENGKFIVCWCDQILKSFHTIKGALDFYLKKVDPKTEFPKFK